MRNSPKTTRSAGRARAGWWPPMRDSARTPTPSCSPPTSASTAARHRPKRPPCTLSTTKTTKTDRPTPLPHSGVDHRLVDHALLDAPDRGDRAVLPRLDEVLQRQLQRLGEAGVL